MGGCWEGGGGSGVVKVWGNLEQSVVLVRSHINSSSVLSFLRLCSICSIVRRRRQQGGFGGGWTQEAARFHPHLARRREGDVDSES